VTVLLNLPLRAAFHGGKPISDANQDLETRIRERAYARWEEDGRPEGRDKEYWERARRFIEAEDDPKAPDMAANPPL
jgi:hypothetical protein